MEFQNRQTVTIYYNTAASQTKGGLVKDKYTGPGVEQLYLALRGDMPENDDLLNQLLQQPL